MFSTFRKYCLLPEKEKPLHCSFMHTFEEKIFLSLQIQKTCSHYLGEIQVSLIFTLNFIYQRHNHRLEIRNLYSLQPPQLQKYADAVAGKGEPSYNCFGVVAGTIACICIPVLNERVVYSHNTRIHGVKFQAVVLPNGLIINFEGQWEGRRHDCVLWLA